MGGKEELKRDIVIIRFEPEGETATMAFTAGLSRYDHPELALISYGQENAGEVRSEIADAVQEQLWHVDDSAYDWWDGEIYFDEYLSPPFGFGLLDRLYTEETRMQLGRLGEVEDDVR